MPLWIPSRDDIVLIKHYASVETGLAAGRLILEPGSRFNIHEPHTIDANINLMLVSKQSAEDCWDDTDLEAPKTLDTFKSGVTLTDDGRAVIDFYVRHKEHGLYGNVTVYYSAGAIQKIVGYGSTPTLYLARKVDSV